MLVVGDVMLDRYWFGDVERISPEAPVPVVLVTAQRGAASAAPPTSRATARRSARRRTLLVGRRRRRGRRARSTQLLEARQRRRRRCTATRASARRVKLRVIGRQQQLLRIDFERAPSREVLARQARRIRAALRRRATSSSSPTTARAASPHIATDDPRARAARQAGAGRSQGRRLLALPRRHAAHAEPRASSREVVGPLERRGGPRATRAQKLRARARRSRRCSSRAARRA